VNTKSVLPLILRTNINVNLSFSVICQEENKDNRAYTNHRGSQNQASAGWAVACSCKIKLV